MQKTIEVHLEKQAQVDKIRGRSKVIILFQIRAVRIAAEVLSLVEKFIRSTDEEPTSDDNNASKVTQEDASG